MSTELAPPPKKPRADSSLKNQPDKLKEEIFEASRTKTNRELSDWITTEKHIPTSASAVSRFLGWFRAHRQGHRNIGANEALADLGKTADEFIKESVVDQLNVTAWHQAQR